ncbi:hypothetical protein FRC03_001721 [Tulasnella sp. 419]|nr:hypothetical protein FRC03_001721 [Tulasnella sp. 419]
MSLASVQSRIEASFLASSQYRVWVLTSANSLTEPQIFGTEEGFEGVRGPEDQEYLYWEENRLRVRFLATSSILIQVVHLKTTPLRTQMPVEDINDTE